MSKLMNFLFPYRPNIATDVTQIVEQIHKEFNTEGERLLEEARAVLKVAEAMNIEKGERLSKLGFTMTKEAVEAREIINQKKVSDEVAKLIVYYQTHYPFQRFITDESVERICKKYNLLKGPVSKYKGTVPDKNLVEIENFKILKKEDIRYFYKHWSPFREDEHTEEINYESYKLNSDRSSRAFSLYHSYVADTYFYICAPVKDFDTKDMVVKGRSLVNIPDPVVLHPVRGGYLIVSAWGPEASDPEVTNSKMN